MYQKWHELLVHMNWKGFGEEVGEVVNAFAPSDHELFLTNSVTDPVKSHVNTLRAFRFYSVQCNAFCAFIIAEDNGGWLWISEGLKYIAKPCTVLTSVKKGRIFGLGC